MKRYGDTNTHLTLSERAQRIYSESAPLSIYEADDGSYTVDLFGDLRTGLTEADVNALIESLEESD